MLARANRAALAAPSRFTPILASRPHHVWRAVIR